MKQNNSFTVKIHHLKFNLPLNNPRPFALCNYYRALAPPLFVEPTLVKRVLAMLYNAYSNYRPFPSFPGSICAFMYTNTCKQQSIVLFSMPECCSMRITDH